MSQVIVTTPEELTGLIDKSVQKAVAEAISTHEAMNRQKSPDKLISKKRAAELLECAISTIDNMRRRGELVPVYIGRAVRFRESDIKKIQNVN